MISIQFFTRYYSCLILLSQFAIGFLNHCECSRSCNKRRASPLQSFDKSFELWERYETACKENLSKTDRILVSNPEDVEKIIASEIPKERIIYNDSGRKLRSGGLNGSVIGAHVDISDKESQSFAMSLIGSVDFLLVTCSSWSMIPAENLVSIASSSPTKVIFEVQTIEQIQGAGLALQAGVDGLLIPSEPEFVSAAEKIKSERATFISDFEASDNMEKCLELAITEASITSVKAAGKGDRVCIDLVQLLEYGEGIFVGSSAKLLALVHGETFETDFVPARPFRVNAGPVHSYILMADMTTKYLSEVVAGDIVLVAKYSFSSVPNSKKVSVRPVCVGRCKIESRPLLMVAFCSNEYIGQIFLQQAETVRLVTQDGTSSITEVKEGDKILIRQSDFGTHIGRIISIPVNER